MKKPYLLGAIAAIIIVVAVGYFLRYQSPELTINQNPIRIKGFMIQGGDPNGNGAGGPGYQFEDELNPNTESYKAGYKKGVVAMANAGPNTNGSQFFIILEDYPLPNNYTIFGKVIKGQETVDAIGGIQTGANDKPLKPVIMEKVTVAKIND